MRTRLPRYALLLALAGIATPALQGDTDPCDGTFAGAMLVGELFDIGLTTSSLKLLGDGENPKLRHLLEFRLVSAIAAARRDVGNNPQVDQAALPNLVPNWLDMVEKATEYVSAHHLENPPFPADGSQRKPLENLQVVKTWLTKQPGGPQVKR